MSLCLSGETSMAHGPFSIYSHVCKLPCLPGEAVTWARFKAVRSDGDYDNWRPPALTKREPVPYRKVGAVLPNTLLSFFQRMEVLYVRIS